MNQKSDNQSNGSWLKVLMDVGRTFGVPTVLLLLISYWLLWQITPPIMSLFVEFISSTMKTQAIIVQTQSEIADTQQKLVVLVEKTAITSDEIIQIEKSTQEFMKSVEGTHNEQMNRLDEILKKTIPSIKLPDSSRITHSPPIQLVDQKKNEPTTVAEKPVLTNSIGKLRKNQ